MPYRCVDCRRALSGDQFVWHFCVSRSTLIVFAAVVLAIAGLFAGLS